MRPSLLLFAVAGLAASTLTAQESPKPAPLVVAGGLYRNLDLTGLQLRGEYSLTRERWIALRLDAGGHWTPSTSVSRLYIDGSRYEGNAQSADLHLGLVASLSPLPRGRFSPYLVAGVAAVQRWNNGGGYYRYADGSPARFVPLQSWSTGEVLSVRGIGVRLRLGSRPLHLEYRQYGARSSAYTLGTTLRF
jgi:hypothetical protein